MSPQRLSDAAITSCGAMRTSTSHVSEGSQDALSALKRAEAMYRQAEPIFSKPYDSDDRGCAKDVLMQAEQFDAGDDTVRPMRAPLAPASIVPAPHKALVSSGGEQQASMWDPDDKEFDRWPGQET
jgi:hypothetical protein